MSYILKYKKYKKKYLNLLAGNYSNQDIQFIDSINSNLNEKLIDFYDYNLIIIIGNSYDKIISNPEIYKCVNDNINELVK